MYTVHCTLYIVHCTLYIVHCTLYIKHYIYLSNSKRTNVVFTNSIMLECFDNIFVILAVPNFHPPTASRVFSFGFIFFNDWNRLNLTDTINLLNN